MGARGKGRPREPGTALGCCCGSIPWVQLLCTLLITAGLVVFFLKSGEAFSSVKALFTDLKVSASAQKVAAAAMEGLLGAGIAVVVAAIVLSVVGLVNSWIGNARRYRAKHGARVTDAASCGSWCQMGTSVLVVLLMWLTLALVVALIAAWTAVLLGSISGDSGAGFAMGTTDSITQKLGGALKRVDALFAKMRGAWNGLLNRVPSFLKSNSWFQDLTRDIGGPIVAGSNDLDKVTCPESCLDLGAFATMVSFDPRCVCGKDLLIAIQTRLRTAWRGAAAALAALGVIAIAASFVLMAQVAGFVNARRDAKDLRDIKADQDYAEAEDAAAAAAAAPDAPGASKAAAAGGRDIEAAAADQGTR